MSWECFGVAYEGRELQCEAKVYDNPSMWGIDDGRVSKLYVYDQDGKELWNYERGWAWDKEAPREIIDQVLARFPA